MLSSLQGNDTAHPPTTNFVAGALSSAKGKAWIPLMLSNFSHLGTQLILDAGRQAASHLSGGSLSHESQPSQEACGADSVAPGQGLSLVPDRPSTAAGVPSLGQQ